MVQARLRASEGIETLVSVANERQACCVFVVASLCGLGSISSTRIVLIDLINGKVLRINVGLQLRLEWRSYAAQAMPINSAEEGMLLDFVGTTNAAEAVFGIADQAMMVC